MDVFDLIGAGSTLTLVGLCYKMSTDKNGRYVRKEVCDISKEEVKIKVESIRNILENRIVELKDDIVEIKADVKELLIRGRRVR